MGFIFGIFKFFFKLAIFILVVGVGFVAWAQIQKDNKAVVHFNDGSSFSLQASGNWFADNTVQNELMKKYSVSPDLARQAFLLKKGNEEKEFITIASYDSSPSKGCYKQIPQKTDIAAPMGNVTYCFMGIKDSPERVMVFLYPISSNKEAWVMVIETTYKNNSSEIMPILQSAKYESK